MSPYRNPAPPPVELARRMSWWERLWLRARRRLFVWWRREPGDTFVPGRRVVEQLRASRLGRARDRRRAEVLRDAAGVVNNIHLWVANDAQEARERARVRAEKSPTRPAPKLEKRLD